jgi:hypothetical protein
MRSFKGVIYMKKVMLLALVALLTACPVACVDDPTDSDALCAAQETDTSADCELEEVDTDTEAVVE